MSVCINYLHSSGQELLSEEWGITKAVILSVSLKVTPAGWLNLPLVPCDRGMETISHTICAVIPGLLIFWCGCFSLL